MLTTALRVKSLDHFWTSGVQIGDKFYYKLKESDLLQIKEDRVITSRRRRHEATASRAEDTSSSEDASSKRRTSRGQKAKKGTVDPAPSVGEDIFEDVLDPEGPERQVVPGEDPLLETCLEEPEDPVQIPVSAISCFMVS